MVHPARFELATTAMSTRYSTAELRMQINGAD